MIPLQQQSSSFDYFNDLSAQVPHIVNPPPIPQDPSSSSTGAPAAEQPRAKRLACALCRKRKLRCDQVRPKCGTCARLGHDCKYDEMRRKSGPKRGYVKALEARLAQVETLLRTSESEESTGPRRNDLDDITTLGLDDPLRPQDHHDGFAVKLRDAVWVGQNKALNSAAVVDVAAREDSASGRHLASHGTSLPRSPGSANSSGRQKTHSPAVRQEPGFPEMIALGLEEPLPMQEIQDELHEIFFNTTARIAPMINKARYFAAMDLAPSMRPPICLRYAIWMHAAAAVDKYMHLVSIFYERSRKYIESDEMRGFGQSMLTLAHVQTWIMLSMHEFRNMFFPRAWMSCGRATRLAQMMSLHKTDGSVLDVKQTLVPPRDETEREERRRTFWFCFWGDRCASIGTGWPMMIEEKDISTNLPGNDDDFQNGQPSPTHSMAATLKNVNGTLSSASGCVIMSALFGRNLIHLHRPDPDDKEEDINGKFWQRHRGLDKTILDISMNLPDHLRVSSGNLSQNVVFLNLCLHTSVICLHQAAIFKSEKHRMAPAIGGESKLRCIAAAAEIASIMRSCAHHEPGIINPFVSFCVYVAARVFVQFLRARPGDNNVLSSLHFLYAMMGSLTKRNPIVESFMAQLELDMEVAGVPRPTEKHVWGSERQAQPRVNFGQGAPDPENGGTKVYKVFPADQGRSPTSGSGASSSPSANSASHSSNQWQMPIGGKRPSGTSQGQTSRDYDPDCPQPDKARAYSFYNPSNGIISDLTEANERASFHNVANERTRRYAGPVDVIGDSDYSSGMTTFTQNSYNSEYQSLHEQPSQHHHRQLQGRHLGDGRLHRNQQQDPVQHRSVPENSSTKSTGLLGFTSSTPFGTLDDLSNFGQNDPFKSFQTAPGAAADTHMAEQDPPISVPDLFNTGQDWDMGGGDGSNGHFSTGLTPGPDASWLHATEGMPQFGQSAPMGPSHAYWNG